MEALSAKAPCVHAPIYSRFHYTIPYAVLSPLHLRMDYGIVKKIRCVKAQGWNAMDENYVCIDIGGTAIKYGVATKGGRLREKGAVATEGKMYGARGVAEKILAIVEEFRDASTAGVAISTLGVVDPRAGRILYAGPSIMDYTGMDLKALVERSSGLPCAVENDVNCAGLGEYWLGAGRGAQSLFCLTVGTDVGGCILLGGRLWRGAGFSAGEVGSMQLAGGRLGKLASVERMVSRAAAAHGISRQELDGETVFDWAKAGDADAVNAIAGMVEPLVQGIANICCVLNPERIVLGGGVMEQGKYLAPRILMGLEESLPPALFAHTEVTFAHLGNDAGMLGALCNFLMRRGGKTAPEGTARNRSAVFGEAKEGR